jgi:mycothiol synthase
MDVKLRPPCIEDVDAIADMSARFSSEYLESPAELRTWFDQPGWDAERNARVAEIDGAVVGYGDVSDAARDGLFVYLDARSDPTHREAVEPVLLDFVVGRGMDLCAGGGALKIWAPKEADGLRALIEGRGFDFDHYSFRMGADLAEAPPQPEWPEGISLRTFRPDVDTEAVYEAHQTAFEEEPDSFRDPLDEWKHWSFREPFDPELWFLAHEGDSLAGISLCRPYRGWDERTGWVQILGVLKPWRRRGLGRALLLHSFGELRAKGRARVGLGVDGMNEGALSLYRGAGMQIERTSAWYRRNA